jgi:hypothetical protein
MLVLVAAALLSEKPGTLALMTLGKRVFPTCQENYTLAFLVSG